MDRFVGDITATSTERGQVRLEVTPGPLRATYLLLDQAEPEFLSRVEDLVTFHDTDRGVAYRYRIVGSEPGPEGGWALLEPVN